MTQKLRPYSPILENGWPRKFLSRTWFLSSLEARHEFYSNLWNSKKYLGKGMEAIGLKD